MRAVCQHLSELQFTECKTNPKSTLLICLKLEYEEMSEPISSLKQQLKLNE